MSYHQKFYFGFSLISEISKQIRLDDVLRVLEIVGFTKPSEECFSSCHECETKKLYWVPTMTKSNIRPSDSALRCSTTEPQRLSFSLSHAYDRRKTNFSISLLRSKFYHLSNSIYKQDALNIADPSSACWMRELRNGLARYRMSGKGCHNSCKTNRTVCSILRSRKASAVSTENPNYDRWESHIHLHWTFNHLICKVIGCLLN